jgi:membrane protein DedA with SNARE-associated domain
MTLESFVNTYGYLAILAGTFFEGETILILGGFAAYRGYLQLPWVIIVAFIGTLSGDQLFFYLGRKHRLTILTNRPSWKARVDKALELFKRFQTYLLLIFRFLYGLRSLVPFVVGASSFPAKRFILFNAAGALVWATLVGTGGYLFGHAITRVIGDIKRYELGILGAVAGIGLAIWLVRLLKNKNERRQQ